jgi:MYXO-CTERM domain-containing protein
MKKLLLTLSIVCAAGVAFGQGQIGFGNATATAITNVATGNKAVTTTRVGFYANATTNVTSLSPGWVNAGGFTNLAAPGVFLGGNRTLGGFPAGTPVAVQVRAWLTTAAFSDYEAALSGEGSGAFGASVIMIINPAVSPTPIPQISANGLRPFTIQPVPEPSSIALGLLGLGAIALFRRRR